MLEPPPKRSSKKRARSTARATAPPTGPAIHPKLSLRPRTASPPAVSAAAPTPAPIAIPAFCRFLVGEKGFEPPPPLNPAMSLGEVGLPLVCDGIGPTSEAGRVNCRL